MAKKSKTQKAKQPLILRAHRLMEAFAKSDDERDFYLDHVEGFILFVDLDKSEEELDAVESEIKDNQNRYHLIPKMAFHETKKIMEGFVNEKVYDIDTKEKLSDIIQSKRARENFLNFLYDQPIELEKWHLFYQERSRINIIEWLRQNAFYFVFEEDLDLSSKIIERLKENTFESKVSHELEVARKVLEQKSKSYYSDEALNPKPKRGRPPKQIQRKESEPQISSDIYLSVPLAARPFLFTPEIASAFDVTFSAKFKSGETKIPTTKQPLVKSELKTSLSEISEKLSALRLRSKKAVEEKKEKDKKTKKTQKKKAVKTVKNPKKRAIRKIGERKPPTKKASTKKTTTKKTTSRKKKSK